MAAILTSENFADRLLGVSQMIEVNTSSVFMATGNNVIASGDMARRLLVCNIDPEDEHPENRVFDFNPEEYVREHLVELRIDVLTVLIGFMNARCPRIKKDSFGSFEEWDALVRQTVLWIGKNNFFSG